MFPDNIGADDQKLDSGQHATNGTKTHTRLDPTYKRVVKGYGAAKVGSGKSKRKRGGKR